MIAIDKTTHRSNAFDERIKFLVIHYTERNLKISLKLLKDKVSAHYLISNENPAHIFQLVDESKRARHAGVSSWQGLNNLNDTSIGIEIVHPGFKKDQNGGVEWLFYDPKQIDSLIELCKDIISRYNIHPTCVVGHSDIAPDRKQDPGPLFPWKQLYDHGIGAWYEKEKVREFMTGDKVESISPVIARRHNSNETAISNNIRTPLDCHVSTYVPPCNDEKILIYNEVNFKATLTSADITRVQQKFKQYGYQIDITGILDEQTQHVVKAFQMHFRPQDFSGSLDVETIGVLEALVERYC